LVTGENAYPKSHRLLTPRDFKHVFQRARKRSAGGLVLYVRANDLGHPRLGIAISRKCSPRAVARNRIKRAIREVFRTRKSELGGWDLVFLGQPGLGGKSAAELRATVENLLSQVESCGRS
jgi:ribonuclease P protein component